MAIVLSFPLYCREHDVLPVPETGHLPAREAPGWSAAGSGKPDHQIIALGE
jgi:hypothetical protein